MIRAKLALSANAILVWIQRGCPAPVPREVRMATWLYYLAVSGHRCFVEADAGIADDAEVLARCSSIAVHAVEASPVLFERAQRRLDGVAGITLHHGGGAAGLRPVLAVLETPALIVLKALPPADWRPEGGRPAPVLEQLMAVLAHPVAGHVVLVEGVQHLGLDGLPPAALLSDLARHARPGSTATVVHDTLRLVPDHISDHQAIDFGALCRMI